MARLWCPKVRSNINLDVAFKCDEYLNQHTLSKADYTALCGSASSHQLRALRKNEWGPLEKRKSAFRQSLDLSCNINPSLVLQPAACLTEFRLANAHNHMSQFLKDSLSPLPISLCLSTHTSHHDWLYFSGHCGLGQEENCGILIQWNMVQQ